MNESSTSWQLGDGFQFVVEISPWPVVRGRPVILTFANGPFLEFIRCFWIDAKVYADPKLWSTSGEHRGELALLPVGSQTQFSPVQAAIRLPEDRESISLQFDVGWARADHYPSHEYSWGCGDFSIRFASAEESEMT